MKQYKEYYNLLLEEHRKVFESQSGSDLEHMMDAIARANKIFVVGAGREGIAARSFAMRLMHLGKQVHWAWDDTTPGAHEGDLFLAVNGSGKIPHIDNMVDSVRETGADIAIVTGAPNERIPKLSNVCLFVPAPAYKADDPRAVESMQPMGNLFEQHLYLMFDILVMMLEERMGLVHSELEYNHRNFE